MKHQCNVQTKILDQTVVIYIYIYIIQLYLSLTIMYKTHMSNLESSLISLTSLRTGMITI